MSEEMWFLNHEFEPEFEPNALPTRARNCVLNAWRTAGWTQQITPKNIAALLTIDDLKYQLNFGSKSLEDLQCWLRRHGCELSNIPFGDRLRVEIEERAELARLKAKYE